MINFSKPSLGKEEEQAVLRILRSNWLAAGAETEAFEKEFASYIGCKYAIFTNSCTSALKMAYKWAVSKGYTDITYPLNTFCATYSAACETALPGEWNIKGNHIIYEPRMGDYKRKTAHISMHYGGKLDTTPCLIEDSAHRIEPNDPLIGKIRCYSFYVTKNMTTGAGGMLVTNDKEIYEKCRIYWKDGLSTSTKERLTKGYDYKVIEYSGGYDGNDLAASIGRVQLRKLPQFTKRRNDIVAQYNRSFKQNWTGNHLYPYFVRNEDEVHGLIQFLKEKGIATGYHYPQTGWLGVSLPLYPDLTDQEVEYIINSVKEYDRANKLSVR